MTLAFVRHGQTGANRSGLLQGRADPPLTELGHRQGALVAAALRVDRPVRVFTSPLRRALETAERIGAVVGAPVEIDERLIELDYGDWEERPIADVSPDDWARWRRDPDFAPPGGETLRAATARIADFCSARLPREGDELVVAVSHVSPIKAAVLWTLRTDETASFRMFLDLASITRLASRGNSVALVSFNEIAHLRATTDDAEDPAP